MPPHSLGIRLVRSAFHDTPSHINILFSYIIILTYNYIIPLCNNTQSINLIFISSILVKPSWELQRPDKWVKEFFCLSTLYNTHPNFWIRNGRKLHITHENIWYYGHKNVTISVVPKCWVHCVLTEWMQWELIFGRESCRLVSCDGLCRLVCLARSATIGLMESLHMLCVQ